MTDPSQRRAPDYPVWPSAPAGSSANPGDNPWLAYPPTAPAPPYSPPYTPTNPPTWPPAPPTAPPDPKRGRGLRVAGLVLLIVSIVGGLSTLGFGLYRAFGSVTDLQRVPASVGGQVNLDSSGVYTIYYEPAPGTLTQDPSGPTTDLPAVQVIGPDGSVATVTPPDGEFSYSFDDHAGRKIAELTADRPGAYRIEPVSASAQSGELAVGGNLGSWLALAFVGPLVAVPIFLTGLVLLIVGFVRRRAR